MANSVSEHGRLELAVKRAVKLELADRREDRLPSVGFFSLPARRHADVFPSLHSLLRDFAPSDADATEEHEALSSRLADIDHEARVREDENALAVVEAILRYGLVNEIQIGWLLGDPLPFAALQHVERFSVRTTWIGTIGGPLSPHEAGAYSKLSRQIARKSLVGFAFGPGFTRFFGPGESIALNDIVVSRSQADLSRRVSLLLSSADPTLTLRLEVSNGEQAGHAREISAPELGAAPATGAYAVDYANSAAPEGWIPLLYGALDDSGSSISQELYGLSRPRTDAAFLAMRLSERFSSYVENNDRERHYLEIATSQLTREGRVSPHVAKPLILPDAVLTPGELEYRALGSVLSAFQDAMGRAGSESPLTQ